MCVLWEPLKVLVDFESIQDVSSFNYAKGKVVAAIEETIYACATKQNK
jgi:hypothetical protein